MDAGMRLVEVVTEFPTPSDGWQIWGRLRSNQLVPLGTHPVRSLGERMIRKYVQYYRVDCRPKSTQIRAKCRSGSGELYFDVQMKVDFRVQNNTEPNMLAGDNPAGRLVEEALIRVAKSLSEEFHAEEYKQFQKALRKKTRRHFIEKSDELQILFEQIDVIVTSPSEVISDAEIEARGRRFREKMAIAEMKGNSDEAARMKRGLDVLTEGQMLWMDQVMGAADRVAKLGALAEAMERDGNLEVRDQIIAMQSSMLKRSEASSEGRLDETVIPASEPKAKPISNYTGDPEDAD